MDTNWLQQRFPDLANLVPLAPSGQKEVFAADHRAEGPVVLKIFKPGADAERIQREMQAPLKIKSPRVPKVAQLGRTASPTGELVWLRERRIDGRSLKDVLKANGKLDGLSTARIALHILEVLAAAEAAEVVHRDIKPGNVIVAADGSGWVIDFGLARHLDQESVTPTMNQWGFGTAGYAPVEQFTNQKRDIDGRTDLFAAGVTLYECAEGFNPFTHGARSPRECLDRIMNSKLPRIAAPDCSREFIDMVDAMTRTKVVHRPATVVEVYQWMREIATKHHIS